MTRAWNFRLLKIAETPGFQALKKAPTLLLRHVQIVNFEFEANPKRLAICLNIFETNIKQLVCNKFGSKVVCTETYMLEMVKSAVFV